MPIRSRFGSEFRRFIQRNSTGATKNSPQRILEALCSSVFHVNAVTIAMRFLTSVPRGRGVSAIRAAVLLTSNFALIAAFCCPADYPSPVK